MTTPVAINNPLSINIAALINNNQSSLNTSISLAVQSATSFTGFTISVSI